jgi:hypothetical protein
MPIAIMRPIGIELHKKLMPYMDVMPRRCLGTLRGAKGALGAAVSGMDAPIPARRVTLIRPAQGCPEGSVNSRRF